MDKKGSLLSIITVEPLMRLGPVSPAFRISIYVRRIKSASGHLSDVLAITRYEPRWSMRGFRLGWVFLLRESGKEATDLDGGYRIVIGGVKSAGP